jgi:hypothetical protein
MRDQLDAINFIQITLEQRVALLLQDFSECILTFLPCLLLRAIQSQLGIHRA